MGAFCGKYSAADEINFLPNTHSLTCTPQFVVVDHKLFRLTGWNESQFCYNPLDEWLGSDTTTCSTVSDQEQSWGRIKCHKVDMARRI